MKRLLRPALLLSYAAALAFSMILAFKAGASVFYYKITLNPENFQRDEGFAYRYQVNLSPAIFPPDRILIFEDGRQLSPANGSEVIQSGDGIYTASASPEGSFYVYLSPEGNSDPTTNGKTYRLYCANNFFSRTMGILYFSILLFGALQFGGFALSPAARSRLRSLTGLLQVNDDFIKHARTAVSVINERSRAPWRSRLIDAFRLWIFTITAAYGLVFMEWLFQVTKPSFMDGLSLGQKLEIFLLSGLALAAAGVAIDIALLVVEFLLRPLRLAWLPICAAAAVPVVLLTTLVVLWLDHFTYTLFHFGILTASNLARTGFGIFIMVILLTVFLRLLSLWGLSSSARISPFSFKLLSRVTLGLVIISAALAIIRVDHRILESGLSSDPASTNQGLPNIILIGSDGMSARNMSVYGYPRETTPQISRLAQDSLVAENAFTNSATTHGSIGSILTGKMPTRTRLVYPPDILLGVDRYEHLPEILKDLGYTTVQLGVPYYVDAYTMNILDGFDTVNQRSIKEDVLVQALHSLGYDLPAYFIQALEESFIDRFSHAFYLETVENPFITVTQAVAWEEDAKKLQDLLALFDKHEAPVFVHAHFMVTHGPSFKPALQTFSAGKQQHMQWHPDFYDDAILTYDQQIGALVEGLKASGEYDNTIIILYSDHAMEWGFNERIPLILHFPFDQYKGRIQHNVQNLDIAPTILDYLGYPVPSWMEGRSLLQPEPEARRLVFSVSTNAEKDKKEENGTSRPDNHQIETQNYQFSVIQVIDCQRWHRLDLKTFTWSSGDIFQHTSPCAEDALLDMAQIKQAVIQHLSSMGFDTSSIP